MVDEPGPLPMLKVRELAGLKMATSPSMSTGPSDLMGASYNRYKMPESGIWSTGPDAGER
jgi:hypothetical protein